MKNLQDIKTLKVFEAFAGIGAQRKALKNIKINHEITGFSEWCISVLLSYHAIHDNFNFKNNFVINEKKKNKIIDYLESKNLSINSKDPVKKNFWKKKSSKELSKIFQIIKFSEKKGNIFDIHNLFKTNFKNTDLLIYSFPCQDLSQQGNTKGMSKKVNSRSGLVWEIEKALIESKKENLPQFLLMENVAALMNNRNKKDLKYWKKQLESFGYKNSIEILNSADFGSSQARKRSFMISSLKFQVNLPKGNKEPRAIKVILDKKFNLIKNEMPALNDFKLTDFKKTKSNIRKARLIDYTTFNSEAYVYDPDYTGPTLTATGANSRIKIKWKKTIRKLNSREAYRYMGFNEKDYKKVDNLNYLSENKKIFTCGNSISVEVMEEIMKTIYDSFLKNKEY